ncbi:hypothetical protein JAAARDRAFT_31063 [Jaapia argillacea MUCL 33604]|uniref:Actin-like ATPase domain-containing protein n=1 Tax=Jaapia argillacea MUCL 33604 TaxID=933084 RepID=A0A067Q5Z7_9AGAM|nr:hypothetical protein JAAARDRAFT_31063 [Jaapia argillacea MUCL 33604]
MSTFAFRDASIVVIDTSHSTVKAVLGLHELLPLPSVTIQARVGLRRSLYNDPDAQAPSPSVKVNDYLVGPALDEAIAAGQDLVISWPFRDGDISDWLQAEAIWKHVLFTALPLRRPQNESPVLLSLTPHLSRASYERLSLLFFQHFNVPAFSLLHRPLAALYATNSLTGLVIDIGLFTTDVDIIYDGFLVPSACVQNFNVGVKHAEVYLAGLLKSNTSVMAILNPPAQPPSPQTLNANLLKLAHKIFTSNLIKSSLSSPSDEDDTGITDIAAVVMAGKEKAIIEANAAKKRKATAAEQAKAKEIEAMDLVEVEWEDGQVVTVGKERHRFCEVFYDAGLVKGLDRELMKEAGLDVFGAGEEVEGGGESLVDVVGYAVRKTDVDMRQYIWNGLFVSGELTEHIRGLSAALSARLTPFILSPTSAATQPEYNEVQPRAIRTLEIPQYFAEWRDKGDGGASFLGGCIIAKVRIRPPKLFSLLFCLSP